MQRDSQIVFFCFPKPWIEPFASIQRLAIRSWQKLQPSRIVLMGDEPGTQEAAQSLGTEHISGIKHNEWHTPLVSSIFSHIVSNTNPDDIVCYINADILIDSTFMSTVQAVIAFPKATTNEWLLIGKRTDLNPDAELLASNDPTKVIQIARQRGIDHGWAGIDYFIFPSRTFRFVYPFALGKFVWDQWLVGNAYRRGLWTVDCSKTVFAAHLNAEWWVNGKPSSDRQAIYDSAEGTRNRSFDHYQKTIYTGTTHYTEDAGNGMIVFRERARDRE